MLKLVAIDLDGTMLTTDKQVPLANIQAVNQLLAKGIKVVICTGRTLPGMERFIAPFNFNEDDDYLILQNGAAIHKMRDRQLLSATYLSLVAKETILNIFKTTKIANMQLVAFDQDHFYLIDEREPNNFVVADSQTLETPVTPITGQELLDNPTIFKMMVLGEPAHLDEWLLKITDLMSDDIHIVRSQPIIVEFLPQNVNKATALKALCEDLAITADEVMAFGDEQNDLEMLQWAKYSVAMGNAATNIKAIAKYETVTNDEAGVGAFLNSKLFSQEFELVP